MDTWQKYASKACLINYWNNSEENSCVIVFQIILTKNLLTNVLEYCVLRWNLMQICWALNRTQYAWYHKSTKQTIDNKLSISFHCFLGTGEDQHSAVCILADSFWILYSCDTIYLLFNDWYVCVAMDNIVIL